ncbi:uncharacterized protein LOC108481623 [Gossypium arboreum]|uniref:uncharacterized protein LOC108481623 n=1 Tax=Gossypium arboreum TaxID=29729 RepID=UPI0022F16001|nr:uncharacterized protein LOC108481623 [Gossypium arboreum]
MESTALSGRMAQWQIFLSEFDIVYVNQKAVKGSAIADFLASKALDDYESLSFDFPNEDLMYVATTKEDTSEDHSWKLNFDGASNAYEACIMRIRIAIERKIRVLEVYGDSALVIYQFKGEWETRDPKLISYRKLDLELIEGFDDITFYYLPRDKNQMADTLATLASMIKLNGREDMKLVQMSICETSAHCCNIDVEEESDDYPWYHDILRYVKSREYPDQATKNDRGTLRRLASDYVLDGEILYKRRKDQVLLRCVDAVEARKILEEVHEEATSYANVTNSAISKFLKKEIICRDGMPERIISDNTLNLNNSVIVESKILVEQEGYHLNNRNEQSIRRDPSQKEKGYSSSMQISDGYIWS